MAAEIRIRPQPLIDFTARLMQAGGATADEAGLVADSLVNANLRGHESHGVMRVLEYTRQLQTGALVPGAALETLSETPAIFAGDASLGFGQVQMRRMIDRVLPKARALGVACGTLRNCGHVGRLGEWVEQVAESGLAAMMSVNDNGVLTCVAPPGGIESRISTNPIAVAVPTGAEPLMFDMSTSAVANGKIRVAQLAGQDCPPGWLQDAAGNPTTDPNSRFADPPGSILPFGGDQAHKGFALGLLFDILVGGLSGGQCPPAVTSAHLANNVLFVVWDPDRFAGQTHFLAQTDTLIASVRETTRQPGVEEIRLPNDRSRSTYHERLSAGIPLDGGTWQALTELASCSDIEVPQLAIRTDD